MVFEKNLTYNLCADTNGVQGLQTPLYILKFLLSAVEKTLFISFCSNQWSSSISLHLSFKINNSNFTFQIKEM